MNNQSLLLLPLLLLAASSCQCASQPTPVKEQAPPEVEAKEEGRVTEYGVAYKVEQLADVDGVVWGMTFLTGDRLLYTLRHGKMGLLDLSARTTVEITGAPAVVAGGQGGLLDVQAHPDFGANKRVYLTYSKQVGGAATTAVAMGTLEGTALVGVEDIFVAEASHPSSGVHYGSRLQFDGKGHIFVTVGDRGERHLAQKLEVHNGKVLRLMEDGSTPPDNPFAEDGPERFIWSLGHRNPQGLYYDRGAGELWEQEHGPRGGDEINLIKEGRNYGWPLISYGKEYRSGEPVGAERMEGMEQPLKVYVPSIAPCGLIRYQGDAFPAWKGSFFSGALALQHLNRVEIKGGVAIVEERLLGDMADRFRVVVEGPEGHIYFGTDSGVVARLVPGG